MKPLYIFDLDGTLALIEHRRHILEQNHLPDKWRVFYAACSEDEPNMPVIRTMEMLRHMGADIWFYSGRSSEVKDKTIIWLAENTSFLTHDLENILMMREEGDYTADDELKKQWYDNMLYDDKQRLIAVFDDRDRVVNMWRSLGVACFQVAKGDF
jgi:hypothetical protein